MSRIVFWLLLGTVLLSPIPFGATLPWSYTLLALIVGALVLVWSTTLLFAGSPPPVTLRMIALQFRRGYTHPSNSKKPLRNFYHVSWHY